MLSNSLTNSLYSVVWHPLMFKDVENHWAKDVVNDMGSRLIVNGIGNDLYNLNTDMTRAEFAAIMMKGLKPVDGKARLLQMWMLPLGIIPLLLQVLKQV
ncbi:S-layer homology domain-containing protein [Paenibacillus sp. LS1]|uniref:S-layer homology domain-containing protein n=1 Tax=Paenibacillus sp. LS1 TaxID=2992120 RepID=UPI00222F0EA6|nr:S-layer homology domain-containing protein [Paenibacillus sp. LS1]MCW3795099.1 S-layer homology domain-containing protein [Paenibacillus sp. LS1]